jgi:hypothetical protein
MPNECTVNSVWAKTHTVGCQRRRQCSASRSCSDVAAMIRDVWFVCQCANSGLDPVVSDSFGLLDLPVEILCQVATGVRLVNRGGRGALQGQQWSG